MEAAMLLWMSIAPRLLLWTAQAHVSEGRSVLDTLREEEPEDAMAIRHPGAPEVKKRKRKETI
jgi:hypothetical protein